MMNIAKALKFLHSANVVHRDIRPEHVLITTDMEVVLCGLGSARSLPQEAVKKGSGNSRRLREAIRNRYPNIDEHTDEVK